MKTVSAGKPEFLWFSGFLNDNPCLSATNPNPIISVLLRALNWLFTPKIDAPPQYIFTWEKKNTQACFDCYSVFSNLKEIRS